MEDKFILKHSPSPAKINLIFSLLIQNIVCLSFCSRKIGHKHFQLKKKLDCGF